MKDDDKYIIPTNDVDIKKDETPKEEKKVIDLKSLFDK